jgi:hypothetical protein
MLPPAAADDAGSFSRQVLSRLRKCSHSFSGGSRQATAAAAGAEQEPSSQWAPGSREVFGLSAGPHGGQAAAAAGFEFKPGQLHCKGLHEPMLQQQQQGEQQLREPLLRHWQHQASQGAAELLQQGPERDCVQQRDQQGHLQRC